MFKKIYICFKNGLYLAADSFVMLFHHPILLIYHAAILVFYCLMFITAYNIIGHFSLPYLAISTEFQIPSQNILAEIIPETGGLLYVALLCSIFLNILLRSYFGIALIFHAYAILTGNIASVKGALSQARNRFYLIVQWALIVTGITFFDTLLFLLPLPKQMAIGTLFILNLLWSAMTFFMLPLIALQKASIVKQMITSIAFMARTITKVCGGMLWAFLLVFIALSAFYMATTFIPAESRDMVGTLGLFAINAVVCTGVVIFKTKLYRLYQRMEHPPVKPLPADYSQF